MAVDSGFKIASMNFWVLYDALHQKGLLDYDDIQNSISRFRDMLDPKDADYPLFKQNADFLESTYTRTRYQPRGPADPRDPQP